MVERILQTKKLQQTLTPSDLWHLELEYACRRFAAWIWQHWEIENCYLLAFVYSSLPSAFNELRVEVRQDAESYVRRQGFTGARLLF